MKFKGFARKLAASSPGNCNKSVMLSEWASSVGDLHRVLDVTRSLYLINQSHNEILLRVGLELATSKIARNIFQWTDGDWYADDSRREWFRDVVQTNLTHVLETCSGEKGDDERLAKANRKVKEVQAELSVAVQKCNAAEALVEEEQSRIQNLESALEVKSEDLLRTQQQLSEAQVKLKEARANTSAIEAKLRETRKDAAAVEAQLRDADAKCLGLEGDMMKHKSELLNREKDYRNEMSGLQEQVGSLEKEKDRVAKSNVDKSKSSDALAEAARAAQSKLVGDLQRKTAELESWVSAAEASKSQSAELRSTVSQLENKIESLQAEVCSSTAANTNIVELENTLLDFESKFTAMNEDNCKLRDQLDAALETSCLPPRTGVDEDKTVIRSRVHESAVERRPVTVEDGMQTDLEKRPPTAPVVASTIAPQAPIAEKTESVSEQRVDAELSSALEDTRSALHTLKAENKQLKTALDGLHTKLKSVASSCHDSGLALRVAEIVSKSEFKQNYADVPVFDRLYGDAMERVDRMERCRRDCLSPSRCSSKSSAVDDAERGCSTSMTSWFAQVDLANCTSPTLSANYGTKLEFLPDLSRASPQKLSMKSLSLPPCSVSRQVSRCASSHHLRSTRRPRSGKLCTSNSVVGIGEELCATRSLCDRASPERMRMNASTSLPFLHGHRLSTRQRSMT